MLRLRRVASARGSLTPGLLLLLLAVTSSVTALVATRLPPAGSAETSVLTSPRSLGALSLWDANRQEVFVTAQLRNRWTLLYTGYLNCPDLCPTTLALLTRLHSDLPHAQQTQLQLAFASIDQQRDSPAALASYTKNFSPKILPLTGTREQLQVLTTALGFIAPPKSESIEPGTQLAPAAIAHSSAIALINPSAQLHALFRYPHDGQQIAATIHQLLN